MNTERENVPQRNIKTDLKLQLSKILPVLLVILTVFEFAHWFLYLSVTRSMGDSNLLKIIYVLGPIVMLAGFLATRLKKNNFLWLTWLGYIWMGIFNIHLLFSFLEFVATLFIQHNYSYWVLFATAIVSVWALYKGLKFPTLITHEISGPAEIKNFKIAQISDLHVGMLHLNQKWLNRVVEKINSENPDIVAITGDLAEGDFSKISKMLVPLQNIKSTCGVFYITGNHEYIHAGDWEGYLESLGIVSLHNQNKIIDFNNQKILVAGIPDRMAPRFSRSICSEPDVALKSGEQTMYKILLAHEPSSIYDIQNEKCDLMLTGHTHGGQIFPFHLGVMLQQPMVSGFKKFITKSGNVLVFNHQGTGFWGPPMRWFSRSEIVILKFK